MDYKEALDYIDGAQWFGAEPSLRRAERLLELLGRPQDGLKYIQIAGTNGKGSCAAMAASIMKAAGYRTGLFSSPYLFRFNERIQINGKQIEDGALAGVVEQVKLRAETMEEHPTEFELMTAAALLYFAAEHCDIVVLETGLGGRFDATNVIKAPECTVIMNIGLDHMSVLGGTVESIAAEKAGIIKAGCPCVLYPQQQSVERVIAERCLELGAPLRKADFSLIRPEFDSLMGQTFEYKGERYALPLLGSFQLRNAAVVLELAEQLRGRGWALEQQAVEHGLYAVSWPARFELCADGPDFIVDGGHNPQCAEALARELEHYFPDKRRVLLVGVMKDKDYEGIIRILSAVADEFVATAPEGSRALDPETLGRCLAQYGKPVTVCADICSAVDTAREKAGEDGMVCSVGSLYLAGSVRYYLGMY